MCRELPGAVCVATELHPGQGFVRTRLDQLADRVDPGALHALAELRKSPEVQRLGYLLDQAGQTRLADAQRESGAAVALLSVSGEPDSSFGRVVRDERGRVREIVEVAEARKRPNAGELLDAIKRGEKSYHFIEIMACPGGCVTGGGQPIVSAQDRMARDPRMVRAQALYQADANMPVRKSHENPEIKQIYRDFLEKPNSHKSHELLHTHYIARPLYHEGAR